MTKTVKVKVAVAVTEDGRWIGMGDSILHSKGILEELTYTLTVPTVYWLTAEIPVPETQEIAAEVEKA